MTNGVSMMTTNEAHDAGMAALLKRGTDAEAARRFPCDMSRLGAIGLRAILGLLESSGAFTVNGGAPTDDDIVAALGAAPRHEWLVRRWLIALCEAGLLTHEKGGGYRRTGTDPEAGAPSDLPAAYAALGFRPAMADLHRAILDQLGAVVRDEVTVQHLLFRDGQVISSLAACQSNMFTAYLNAACAEIVVDQARGLSRPLRVIELGAGTGLTSEVVMETLGGRAFEYVFTDVSPLFLNAARSRFPGHAGLRFALVDINADFEAQGIAPGSADTVLAANVLHNATNVRRMLRRLHRVLSPGGRLVFIESVRESPSILTSMQFLLSPAPGAPLLGGEDCRAGSGEIFLTGAAWTSELQSAGFIPQDCLPLPGSPLAAAGQMLFFAVAGSGDDEVEGVLE